MAGFVHGYRNTSNGGGGASGGPNELGGVTYDPTDKQLVDATGDIVPLEDLEEGPFFDMFGNQIPET